MNSSTALNFMRSAKAPTMRQGVMQAKVSWKMNQANSGMYTPLLKVAATELVVMPLQEQPVETAEERRCRW